MKTKIFLTILILTLCFAFATDASAIVHEFQPDPTDLYGLPHQYYFIWGIEWTPPEGEQIVGATFSIPQINNWNSADNILYVHLLDTVSPGVTWGWDGQGEGDNIDDIAGGNIHLFDYTDDDGDYGNSPPWGSIYYPFELPPDLPDEPGYNYVPDLINFINNDGKFGIGLDPDCHFWNYGVYLHIETRAIPEPATIFLLASGLLGGLGFRRKW